MRKLSEAEFRERSLSANVYILIIQIGFPLAVFALFATLFSLLDTAMASHLGTIDVSTVAYMNQLWMILNSLGTGLGTGSMILINRAYGAGDKEKTNELVNTLIRILLILSIIFLLMIPFASFILNAIGTPWKTFLTGVISSFSLILLIRMIARVNPRPAAIPAVNDSRRLYPSSMFMIAMPRTAQLVVMSGR